MRINARLDEAAARQVTELTTATGQSVSHVVREAIAVYHAQVRGARRGSGSKFLALIGTGDSGRTDIASNYKALFGQYLDEKFARQQRPPAKPGAAGRKPPRLRTAGGA